MAQGPGPTAGTPWPAAAATAARCTPPVMRVDSRLLCVSPVSYLAVADVQRCLEGHDELRDDRHHLGASHPQQVLGALWDLQYITNPCLSVSAHLDGHKPVGVGGFADARKKNGEEKMVVEGLGAHLVRRVGAPRSANIPAPTNPPVQQGFAAAMVEAYGEVASLVVGAKEGVGRVDTGPCGPSGGRRRDVRLGCGAWGALVQIVPGVGTMSPILVGALRRPVGKRGDMKFLMCSWAGVVPGRHVKALGLGVGWLACT